MQGTFEVKGVKKDRLSMVTGDVREPFGKEVVDAKVDTITMKHFLSAFSDSDARLIVKHCGMALTPGGKILLLQVRPRPCHGLVMFIDLSSPDIHAGVGPHACMTPWL